MFANFAICQEITKVCVRCSVFVFLVIIVCGSSGEVQAQKFNPNLAISEKDVAETIASMKTEDAKKSFESLKKNMPSAISDQKFRARILDTLPDVIKKNEISNNDLKRPVKELFGKILGAYGRNYELVIINVDVPFAMIDSGTVLVVSTKLILDAESDDELLGYVAHEVGHEYFGEFSVFTKLLEKVSRNRNFSNSFFRRADELLSIIELSCDSFAAISLSALGYDPMAFIDGFERTSSRYKWRASRFHPPDRIRRAVVEGVIPVSYIEPKKRRVSNEMSYLKDQIKGIKETKQFDN